MDFFNDHGLNVRLDATTQTMFDAYVEDLEKRGAGDYHLRDSNRYAGGFVASFPSRPADAFSTWKS